jgi:hypothetical protein
MSPAERKLIAGVATFIVVLGVAAGLVGHYIRPNLKPDSNGNGNQPVKTDPKSNKRNGTGLRNDQTLLVLSVDRGTGDQVFVYLQSKQIGAAPLSKELYFSVDEMKKPVVRLIASTPEHCDAPFYGEAQEVALEAGQRRELKLAMTGGFRSCWCSHHATIAARAYADPSASGFLSWLRSTKQWRESVEADLQKLREDPLFVSISNLYASLTTKPPATGTLGIPEVPVWSMPVNAAGAHNCDAGRQTSRVSLLALAPDQVDALVKWLSIQHGLGSAQTDGSIINTTDRVSRDIEGGLRSVLARGRDTQIEKAANDEYSAMHRLRSEAEGLRTFLETARKYMTERLKEADKTGTQQ